MTDTMRTISDALPAAIPAIRDPWLGASGFAADLAVLAAWAAVALLVTARLARRPR